MNKYFEQAVKNKNKIKLYVLPVLGLPPPPPLSQDEPAAVLRFSGSPCLVPVNPAFVSVAPNFLFLCVHVLLCLGGGGPV